MNPISKTPFGTIATAARCMALAAPLLLSGVSQAEAATSCPDAQTLDARLNSLAERGAAPLVQFVHRTRTIYQLDVAEALERIAAYRQSTAACGKAIDA